MPAIAKKILSRPQEFPVTTTSHGCAPRCITVAHMMQRGSRGIETTNTAALFVQMRLPPWRPLFVDKGKGVRP